MKQAGKGYLPIRNSQHHHKQISSHGEPLRAVFRMALLSPCCGPGRLRPRPTVVFVYPPCAVHAHQASEVEETLKRIRSHRGVEGILIVNNDGVSLKSTLSAELTTQYASLFAQLASKARNVIRTLDATNDLTFLRVRSNKHEIMVAPDKDYLLIVIQNPSADESKV